MKSAITLYIVLVAVLSPGPAVTYYAEVPHETVTHVTFAKVSAYTSDPLETDDTPTITASGSTTRHGIVANNCLEFGSEVEIQGKVYVVEDRMNSRYGCERYDIWMLDKVQAIQWGVQELAVKLLE